MGKSPRKTLNGKQISKVQPNEQDEKITPDEEVKLERYIKVSHYLDKKIIIHQNNQKENEFEHLEGEAKKNQNEDFLLNLLKDMKKKPLRYNEQFLLNGELMKTDQSVKKKKCKKRLVEGGNNLHFVKYTNNHNRVFENIYNKENVGAGNDALIEKNQTFKFETPMKMFSNDDDEILNKKEANEQNYQKSGPCNACLIF